VEITDEPVYRAMMTAITGPGRRVPWQGVIVALIMAGYCLWLTTTSLSYARVNTVENELLLSLGVFLFALAGSLVIIMRWVRSKQSRPSSKTT